MKSSESRKLYFVLRFFSVAAEGFGSNGLGRPACEMSLYAVIRDPLTWTEGVSRISIRRSEENIRGSCLLRGKKMYVGRPVCVHQDALQINTNSDTSRLNYKVQSAETTFMWLQNLSFSMSDIKTEVSRGSWRESKHSGLTRRPVPHLHPSPLCSSIISCTSQYHTCL